MSRRRDRRPPLTSLSLSRRQPRSLDTQPAPPDRCCECHARRTHGDASIEDRWTTSSSLLFFLLVRRLWEDTCLDSAASSGRVRISANHLRVVLWGLHRGRGFLGVDRSSGESAGEIVLATAYDQGAGPAVGDSLQEICRPRLYTQRRLPRYTSPAAGIGIGTPSSTPSRTSPTTNQGDATHSP